MLDLRDENGEKLVDYWYHDFVIDGVHTNTDPTKDHSKMWDKFQQVLDMDKIRDKTVLDVACNAGWYIQKFESQGNCVVGVEMDDDIFKQLQFIKKYYNLSADIIKANFETWQTNDTFDFVLFSGILYHLENPNLGLKKAFSLSNEDVLIETAYSLREGSLATYHILEDTNGGQYMNKYMFTNSALIKLIDHCGGTIINELHYTSSGLEGRKIIHCKRK